MIYLDNAATSWPKPEQVYQTMDEFLRKKGGNPGRGGHSLSLAATEVVEETRLLTARLIHAPHKDRVVFTLNCTDALNLGLKGLLKGGDHVITSCIGHNSLVRPLRKLENSGVAVTRIPPLPEEGFIPPESIISAIRKNTKLIVVTHVSNVTGLVQPIEEYGLIARTHGLIFMVDAAQSAGIYPLDVEKARIDLLAFSGHKGLLGATGTGVLYIGERVSLDSLREGGTGSSSELEEQPEDMPNRYESGTPNTLGIAGLGAGLKFLFQEGMDKIRAHKLSLRDRLLDGLEVLSGIIVYGPKDRSWQAPVLSLNIRSFEPGEVSAILDQAFDIKVRAGLHCTPAAHKTIGTYPKGTVRLSPGYFNTMEEMDFTVSAIEKIAHSQKL